MIRIKSIMLKFIRTYYIKAKQNIPWLRDLRIPKLLNYLCTILGFLCVGFAILGIFLPVLPTTPWLLLAAWLFYKGNPKMRIWLLNNKYLGSYIDNYIKYRAIPLKSKIISISMLWITILFSVYIVNPILLKILLLCIAVGVTIHLLMIKTLK